MSQTLWDLCVSSGSFGGNGPFHPELAAFSLLSVQGLCNVAENALVFFGGKQQLKGNV